MKTSKEIRKKFLDFFASRNHPIIPSDSLVPSSDPTLLFTSAGMVQFKDYFAGKKSDLTRAVSCQKCFRTTDLERIGMTPRHLSFFEMLGNFSFGDYFKKEAIQWGWEFLTKEMNIPSDKLYVTIYKDDDEAFQIWKNIISEKKIYRLGDETNFWNMGPTGPCGPCSEIIYDTGESNGCGKKNCDPSCDCPRWLEVWNLVFTQFNRLPDGKLEPLPRKNIDTGMGLERLVMVVNGAAEVFSTDLFKGIIQKASDELGVPEDVKTPQGILPLRLIADHARASLFLLGDGIMPSNDGRGYVLRRIIRRAQRFGRVLGYEKPFLYKVISSVMDIMSEAYPQLLPQFDNISAILKNEELKFLETLDSGISVLENLLQKHKSNKHIPGEDAFNLYETYGFPYDLTLEICSERGYTIDEDGFRRAQEEARKISRASWKGSSLDDRGDKIYSTLLSRLSPTKFLGYESLSLTTTIDAIISGGKMVDRISEGEEGEVFLKETPFYAESGGQISDTGEIIVQTKGKNYSYYAEVIDVQKIPAGEGEFIFIHKIKIKNGSFSVGNNVLAKVDISRRQNIARHHTATHLLHKALREILGSGAVQSGSLVSDEYLRFDFAYPTSPTQEQLEKIEDEVNEIIRKNLPVCIVEEELEKAKKRGATALFGEKYHKVVRSVGVGENDTPYSLELCGGTHVRFTGEIGYFKILQESSVGSGVRRITAVAGKYAEAYLRENEHLLSEISEILKAPKNEIITKINRLITSLKDLEKKLTQAQSKNIQEIVSSEVARAENINGILFVSFTLPEEKEDPDLKGLKKDKLGAAADMVMSDIARRKNDIKGAVSLIIEKKSPTSFAYVVSVSEKLVNSGGMSFFASEIAKVFAKSTNGSGGGKNTFARGGGKEFSKIPDGISAVENYLRTISNTSS